jgi:hypothetical protein
LLEHLEGEQAATGKAMFTDIEQRMVKPMKAAFQKGDRESGLRIFINYVLDGSNAWQKMPQDAHKDMLAHAHEWDVMMSSGELFPKMEPQAIRAITTPTLLLSGERSYPFLGLIDQELTRLLPHARRIILRGATHRMWFEQPDTCRNAVLDFLREPVSALARKENHSLRRPGSPTRASRDGVEACAQLLPRAGFFGSRDAMQRSANKKIRFYPKDTSARLRMLTGSDVIIS